MTKVEKESFLEQFRLRHQLNKILEEIEAIEFDLETLKMVELDSAGKHFQSERIKELERLESNTDVMLYRQMESWETED